MWKKGTKKRKLENADDSKADNGEEKSAGIDSLSVPLATDLQVQEVTYELPDSRFSGTIFRYTSWK